MVKPSKIDMSEIRILIIFKKKLSLTSLKTNKSKIILAKENK